MLATGRDRSRPAPRPCQRQNGGLPGRDAPGPTPARQHRRLVSRTLSPRVTELSPFRGKVCLSADVRSSFGSLFHGPDPRRPELGHQVPLGRRLCGLRLPVLAPRPRCHAGHAVPVVVALSGRPLSSQPRRCAPHVLPLSGEARNRPPRSLALACQAGLSGFGGESALISREGITFPSFCEVSQGPLVKFLPGPPPGRMEPHRAQSRPFRAPGGRAVTGTGEAEELRWDAGGGGGHSVCPLVPANGHSLPPEPRLAGMQQPF